MEGKKFPKDTKPREIFVYTCGRIAEPLMPIGFQYRKSKNDIYKKEGLFLYRILFQPSIQFSSTTFSVHIAVDCEQFAIWRKNRYGNEAEDGNIVLITLASLTKREQIWPEYEVSTFLERERSIAEITQQIVEFAIPFFNRFANSKSLAAEVKAYGFLPHRKRLYQLEAQKIKDFVEYFS